VPRPAAEIAAPFDGQDVLDGVGRVATAAGTDVSAAFRAGAELALAAAARSGARLALLTARSPSCGSGEIYDGRFSGHLRAGDGVTAALLRRNGIRVFAPSQLAALALLMDPA
jgi:uncharacterized protein YbbK (DUF523 family)